MHVCISSRTNTTCAVQGGCQRPCLADAGTLYAARFFLDLAETLRYLQAAQESRLQGVLSRSSTGRSHRCWWLGRGLLLGRLENDWHTIVSACAMLLLKTRNPGASAPIFTLGLKRLEASSQSQKKIRSWHPSIGNPICWQRSLASISRLYRTRG